MDYKITIEIKPREFLKAKGIDNNTIISHNLGEQKEGIINLDQLLSEYAEFITNLLLTSIKRQINEQSK